MTYYAERTCYGIDPQETVLEQNITNIRPKFLMLYFRTPSTLDVSLSSKSH